MKFTTIRLSELPINLNSKIIPDATIYNIQINEDEYIRLWYWDDGETSMASDKTSYVGTMYCTKEKIIDLLQSYNVYEDFLAYLIKCLGNMGKISGYTNSGFYVEINKKIYRIHQYSHGLS